MLRTHSIRIMLILILCVFMLSQITYAHTYTPVSSQQTAQRQSTSSTEAPSAIQLDRNIPIQTIKAQNKFTNINAKFGSRFRLYYQSCYILCC